MGGSNLSRAIRETQGKIHVLECIESAGVIMEDDSITLRCLYNKMEALNHQQHSYWWNKSKSAWIEDGDRNTKYFHSPIRHRKTRNWIHFLIMRGNKWLTKKTSPIALSSGMTTYGTIMILVGMVIGVFALCPIKLMQPRWLL